MLLLKNVSLGSLSELNLDSWLYQEFVNKIIRVSRFGPFLVPSFQHHES